MPLAMHAPSIDLPPRLLTVQEYNAMIEAGILTEDDKVELLQGRIVAMSPAGSSHASPVNVMTRLVKAPLYAAAGIPEYWIELPEQGAIEVYSRPLDGRYAEMHTYTGGDVVTPGPAPEVLVRVQDVLG